MEPAAVENNDPAVPAVIAETGIAVDDELLVEEISIDGMCGVY
jgi:mycofactocin precursor